ncbi:putative membrane protein YedE/YeeE [Rhodoblastus acidophilus]|uniref:YeeE/YedE family protein n=1 Tax=Rhodoblastus acidophilus TaxID=1074 RepID=UPI002224B8C7|nr:YeeE/YedE thiosulfate transporter family protein [Rhodoblastus acidophilus]MCW2283435.1 putative membrane protein YedE/YeeE [Rhodoblastus acidophilus]MCW2332241.1 putative membrane protein YedE/YeeE [Rhodoblastus acidophilus]
MSVLLQIDWAHFTPLSALAGGALIGLAVALLLLREGRILGASGIFAGLAQPRADFDWRLAFLAGLVAAPALAGLLFGVNAPRIAASPNVLIVAGFLVGLGARLGNGCTSGHGICGLARLSKRSLAATATFMAAGFATVFVFRHLLG